MAVAGDIDDAKRVGTRNMGPRGEARVGRIKAIDTDQASGGR